MRISCNSRVMSLLHLTVNEPAHINAHFIFIYFILYMFYSDAPSFLTFMLLYSTASRFNFQFNYFIYQWLCARLQYLQCISTGDTAVLHRAVDMLFYTVFFFCLTFHFLKIFHCPVSFFTIPSFLLIWVCRKWFIRFLQLHTLIDLHTSIGFAQNVNQFCRCVLHDTILLKKNGAVILYKKWLPHVVVFIF